MDVAPWCYWWIEYLLVVQRYRAPYDPIFQTKLLQTSQFLPGPSVQDFLHLITIHLWVYVLIIGDNIDQSYYGENDEKTPDQEAGQLWLQSGGSQ